MTLICLFVPKVIREVLVLIDNNKAEYNTEDISNVVMSEDSNVEEYEQLSFFDIGRSKDMKVIEVLQELSKE